MSGRPKRELVLSESEFEQLKALTMRRKTAQALALRARIVLACAEGMDNKTVAANCSLHSKLSLNGARGLSQTVWTDCLTRHAPVRPGQSTTRMSMLLLRGRLSPYLPGRRTGALERWPER